MIHVDPTLGNRRVYVAGDTESTPEVKALKDIDIAFLPGTWRSESAR